MRDVLVIFDSEIYEIWALDGDIIEGCSSYEELMYIAKTKNYHIVSIWGLDED